MHTRREVLRGALVIPFAAAAVPSSAPRIIAGPDCLSQESAAGFRSVLPSSAANLIVLCGTSCVDRFHLEALKGAWIICDASPFTTTRAAISGSASELYVRYRWPHIALTRCFSRVIPVSCPDAEAIAHYRGGPIALKRRMGLGGIIYLGSMLGPNLRAEEPEARQLAKAIFSEIACGDTSTAASANTSSARLHPAAAAAVRGRESQMPVHLSEYGSCWR